MNIEELAFKDRKNLAQLNELDLLDIIEFLQKDRKEWINQFTKTHNESIDIQKENQSLKKRLEEYKATNEILSQELTKDKVLQQDHLTTCCGIPIGDIPKLITQQKEFIKYLEDEMLECSNNIFGKGMEYGLRLSLSKFKEIIGVKNE